jgi:hypothetical protein
MKCKVNFHGKLINKVDFWVEPVEIGINEGLVIPIFPDGNPVSGKESRLFGQYEVRFPKGKYTMSIVVGNFREGNVVLVDEHSHKILFGLDCYTDEITGDFKASSKVIKRLLNKRYPTKYTEDNFDLYDDLLDEYFANHGYWAKKLTSFFYGKMESAIYRKNKED